jgi:hypothetical protein
MGEDVFTVSVEAPLSLETEDMPVIAFKPMQFLQG